MCVAGHTASSVSPQPPHRLPLPHSWNSLRIQEPSQMVTPPSSSILRPLQSQCTNLVQFCQQSVPHCPLRLQSGVFITVRALVWGSTLRLHWVLSVWQSLWWQILTIPLLLELVFFFWATPFDVSHNRLWKRNLFPSQKAKAEQPRWPCSGQ